MSNCIFAENYPQGRFMVSKNDIKFIHSLSLKKNRDVTGMFVAEGRKIVSELLGAFDCERLFYTDECADCIPSGMKLKAEAVSKDIIGRLSSQKSPQGILAVFRKPEEDGATLPDVAARELCLALDEIQDPGNMGTIVRIADWFGIGHIFAGEGTADVYSPKVIGATMGALVRVKVHYVDLSEQLSKVDGNYIYGTFLDGDNIYQAKLSDHGVIVMGNEGNGISPEVGRMAKRRLLIPSFPSGRPTSESLNVAIATSIVCAEFRRRMNS